MRQLISLIIIILSFQCLLGQQLDSAPLKMPEKYLVPSIDTDLSDSSPYRRTEIDWVVKPDRKGIKPFLNLESKIPAIEALNPFQEYTVIGEKEGFLLLQENEEAKGWVNKEELILWPYSCLHDPTKSEAIQVIVNAERAAYLNELNKSDPFPNDDGTSFVVLFAIKKHGDSLLVSGKRSSDLSDPYWILLNDHTYLSDGNIEGYFTGDQLLSDLVYGGYVRRDDYWIGYREQNGFFEFRNDDLNAQHVLLNKENKNILSKNLEMLIDANNYSQLAQVIEKIKKKKIKGPLDISHSIHEAFQSAIWPVRQPLPLENADIEFSEVPRIKPTSFALVKGWLDQMKINLDEYKKVNWVLISDLSPRVPISLELIPDDKPRYTDPVERDPDDKAPVLPIVDPPIDVDKLHLIYLEKPATNDNFSQTSFIDYLDRVLEENDFGYVIFPCKTQGVCYLPIADRNSIGDILFGDSSTPVLGDFISRKARKTMRRLYMDTNSETVLLHLVVNDNYFENLTVVGDSGFWRYFVTFGQELAQKNQKQKTSIFLPEQDYGRITKKQRESMPNVNIDVMRKSD